MRRPGDPWRWTRTAVLRTFSRPVVLTPLWGLLLGLNPVLPGSMGSAKAQSQSMTTAATAQEGISLAVEQAVLRESNPLRFGPEERTPADTAAVSVLDGAYRHGWGRQRWLAFGRLARTHYANESALDHETYRVGARVDWETLANLGARLSWQRQQDALEGQGRLDPITGDRRLQMFEQLGTVIHWGAQRRWGLEAQWQHEQLRPNRPQTWWPGYEQDTWRLRARGDVAQTWFWAVGRRELEGQQAAVATPTGVSPEVSYRMGVWDVEWNWVPRPGDGLTLRVANGRGLRQWLTATGINVLENQDGASGQASTDSAIKSLQAEIRWRPIMPVNLSAALSRDRGQQVQGYETGISGAGFILQGANEVRQARLGVLWELGHSRQLRIDWHVIDRTGSQSWLLDVNQQLLSTPMLRWQDRLDRRSLGVGWDITRRASAQCAVRQELRSGRGFDDGLSGLIGRPLIWRDTQWQCSLRWRIR